MTTPALCPHCGVTIEEGAQFCSGCGAQVGQTALHDAPKSQPTTISIKPSPKSATTALILCLFFGAFGLHRFYAGKIGTGILMLLTAGGIGIWILVDLILIVTNRFTDGEDRPLVFNKELSTSKKVISIAGAILAWVTLFTVGVVALVFYATSGLVNAVKNELDALKMGNISLAYSYTSKDFQKATPINNFAAFLNQYPSLKNNSSYFFSSREIENDTGTVAGTLTAKDGARTPIEFKLIKEDGVWKILSIKVSYTGAGASITNP